MGWGDTRGPATGAARRSSVTRGGDANGLRPGWLGCGSIGLMIRGHSPIYHVNRPICAVRELVIVRDHEDGRAGGVDRLQQVHDLGGHGGIEIAGWVRRPRSPVDRRR